MTIVWYSISIGVKAFVPSRTHAIERLYKIIFNNFSFFQDVATYTYKNFWEGSWCNSTHSDVIIYDDIT